MSGLYNHAGTPIDDEPCVSALRDFDLDPTPFRTGVVHGSVDQPKPTKQDVRGRNRPKRVKGSTGNGTRKGFDGRDRDYMLLGRTHRINSITLVLRTRY